MHGVPCIRNRLLKCSFLTRKNKCMGFYIRNRLLKCFFLTRWNKCMGFLDKGETRPGQLGDTGIIVLEHCGPLLKVMLSSYPLNRAKINL